MRVNPRQRTSTRRLLRLLLVAGLHCPLLGCGIPERTTREPETRLPDQYVPHPSGERSEGRLSPKSFFKDPQLSRLIDTAIANNKDIRIMMQRISAAENEIEARQGAYLPMVRAGAGVGAEKPGEYTFNGSVERYLPLDGQPFPSFVPNYQFGLVSSWEIDIWRKLRNATEVAMLEYMATVEGKNFLVTNLVAEVAHAYYELLSLDNQLKNLDENLALQEHALEMVQALQFYARADMLAVRRYEAEVSKNRGRRYDIKQQIVVLENRLSLLLGKTSHPIERDARRFLEEDPGPVATGVPPELLENRPDIRQAALTLGASGLNIEVARAEFFPSFGIRAGIGYESFALKYLVNTPESLAAMVAGELAAPLINRNAISAAFKTANAQQVEAAYAYEKTLLTAYMDVQNQLSNMENSKKSFELRKVQVDQLVNAIEVALQLFKSARTHYLDVLTTQRDALDARRDLIENRQRQWLARIELYRGLGGGWQ